MMDTNRRKTWLKWLALTGLLIYSVGICLWANDISTTERCRSIDIRVANSERDDTIVREGISELIRKFNTQIKGRSLREIDIRGIENYLGSWSNFESVQVSLGSTGVMHIDVVQMMPEVRVFDGSRSYYINKDGKQISSGPEFYRDVPIVAGNFTKEWGAVNVLPVVRAVQADPFMRDLVTMVKVDNKDNILLVPRIKGHLINIGDTCRLPAKLAKVKTMYTKVIPYKGWNTYDTINVKYRGQIVATKADKSAAVHSLVTDTEEDLDEDALQAAGLTEESVPQNQPKPEQPGN